MAMATRTLAAVAGRRAAGQSGLAVLSSYCRRGGGASHSFSHSSSAAEPEGGDDAAAQVEAALNRKNVDVVQGDRSATLLAGEAADALRGAGADDVWVPDQETGVFVPADEAASGSNGGHEETAAAGSAAPSVLDQAVFVREDMEDVERPAVTVDVADAGAK